METLRSPKQLAGPALGIPSLTFRAWFEAQFGRDAWDALDKIPRLQWMDYLRWYREALALPVQNGHRVTDMRAARRRPRRAAPRSRRPHAAHAARATSCSRPAAPASAARRCPAFAEALPRARWAHSSDDNDYARSPACASA